MKNKVLLFLLILFLIIACSYDTSDKNPFNTSSDFEANEEIDKSETWVDSICGIEFIWIPPGCIEIGLSDEEEISLSRNEEAFENLFKFQLPRHKVCVDGSWVSKFEITVRQFRQFAKSSNFITDAENIGWVYDFVVGIEKTKNLSWKNAGFVQGDNHPVVNVSWKDAKAMADWLTNQGSGIYRLPSEAEWEYACRAGETSVRYWGDQSDAACNFANIFDLIGAKKFKGVLDGTPHNCEDGYETTSQVGVFRPNAFGLYDMTGNVAEWCEDTDTGDNYTKHQLNNPVVLEGGDSRVIRGGGWASMPVLARSADRQYLKQTWSNNVTGFRLVKIR